MRTGIKTLTPQEPNERERKKIVIIVIHFFVKYITLILGNIKFNHMLKVTEKFPSLQIYNSKIIITINIK